MQRIPIIPVLLGLLLSSGCLKPQAPAALPVTTRPTPAPAPAALAFCIREGVGDNCMVQGQSVTAHVIATSGPRGRLVVAFPAGNAGAGLWVHAPAHASAALTLVDVPTIVQRAEGRGIRFRLRSETPLHLERAVLGSVRTIRNYHDLGKLDYYEKIVEDAARAIERIPPTAQQQAAALGITPAMLRDRMKTRLIVERAAPLRLRFEQVSLDGKQRIALVAASEAARWQADKRALLPGRPGKPWELEIEVMSSYPPLRLGQAVELVRPEARQHLERLAQLAQAAPLARKAGATARAKELETAARSLLFLTTQDKYLAGSWRFLTYFGRDTMMTMWLLQPVLTPHAFEIGLQSVLDRLSEDGQVAHEESIGDQAMLEHLARFKQLRGEGKKELSVAELGKLSQPVYDYAMIDDDFMLPALLAAYLADPLVSAKQAQRFFAGRTATALANGQAIARNLSYVVSQARAYAASQRPTDLVALRADLPVGDWRDSVEGLGGGRYPASVNAYLVPIALEAIAKLAESKGQLAAAKFEELATQLPALRKAWATVGQRFSVRLAPEEIRRRLSRFLEQGPASAREREQLRRSELEQGLTLAAFIDRGRVPRALAENGLIFDALALDAEGQTIEVMHTDDAFLLLAKDVPLEELGRRLLKYELPYPVGLRDRYGVYVANPALSRRVEDYRTFDRGHYHGTVVWSWQLSMLQLGLMRQLRNCRAQHTPAAAALAHRLEELLRELQAIEARVGALRNTELWTVQSTSEGFRPVAYGHASGQATESNVLQLWSNVNLAVDLQRSQLGLSTQP